MRVLLAGASGTLGRALLPQLLTAGHEVLGITRSAASAERLHQIGADAVVADVLDREALMRSLEGHRADAVIHELTALTKAPLFYSSMTATNDLRERGTAHLVEAAHTVGATRMLTQSIVLGYGFRTHAGTIKETAPFGVPEDRPVDRVLAALVSTEQQVMNAEGIEGIALRYGLFYGLDAPMVTNILRKRMMPVTSFNGLIPYIHHEDAAAATVAALERGIAGRAYNVADNTGSTWRACYESAARAFGAPSPLSLPRGLVRALLPYAGELMTRVDLHVSSELAKRELGWTPRYVNVAAGWAAAAA